MSRPRSPEDPERFPIPCARCNEHRAQATRWPDGYICQNCYRKAIRTTGSCVTCRHEGILPGVSTDGPTCRKCSGIRLNVDCVQCGKEDELYSKYRCWSCTFGALVDEVLSNPGTGIISPALVPFADALKAMKRANSGLTWIRQKHVQDVLKQIALKKTINHETIDSLPNSVTTQHVRGLLVVHGVLTWRDEYLHTFHLWSDSAMERIESDEHVKVVKQYLRWHQQRRLLNSGPVTRGRFLRAKQDTTVAIDFLNWLHQHGYRLDSLNQAQYEEWKTGGTSTRLIATRFLNWAMKIRLTPTWDEPYAKSSSGPRLSSQAQDRIIEEITRSEKLPVRDQAVGILVLIFAQQIEKICLLTYDDLKITKSTVRIRLGKIDMDLPPPLDEPFRALAANPMHHQTAAHHNSKWLFPSTKPGRPLGAGYLSNRIKKLLPARAARLGSLKMLSALAPAPIIAEALGYNVQTVEAARIESGDKYARYIGAIKDSAF